MIPRLSVVQVSKSYGARSVLDGIDLSIEPATVVAITGHNGSGKSTLLRCVAGLASYQGSILIDGTAPDRSRIGYLPQHVEFPSWATIGETLSFFARLRGVDPDAHQLPPGFVPENALPVSVLSGGQRQRVALAVALLGAPSLVLLDEPAASLDDQGRAVLSAVIGDLAGVGAVVVIATPRADDLVGMSDVVVRLVDGKTETNNPEIKHLRLVDDSARAIP